MPRLWSNQGDLHCRPQARRQRRPLCWQTLQRSQSRRQPAKPWKPAPPIRKLWRLLRQAQTHPAPAFSQLSPLQHQSRAPPARQVGCRGMSRAPTLHAKKWQAFGFDEVWSCMLFSAMCIRAPRTLCLCFYWLPRQYIMHATECGCPQPCPGWEWVYQQGVETSQPGLAGQIKVLTCGTCLRVPWLVRSAVVGRVMTWESIAGGTAGSNGDRSLGFRDLNCWLGDVSGSCDRSRSKLAMGTGPLVSEISSAGRVISWEGGAGGGARWRW